MRHTLIILALSACWACADPAPMPTDYTRTDDASPQPDMDNDRDMGVEQGDMGNEQGDAEAQTDPDSTVGPDLDAAVGPDPDAAVGPDPDAAIIRPTGLSVSITLTEQPQAETASITAVIGPPTDIEGAPGCQSVQVDANAQPNLDSQDGGDLVVSGLAAGDITLGYVGGRYHASSAPDDLFNNQSMIQVTGAGGPALAPFNLSVPAPRELSLQSPLPFSETSVNAPLDVRWPAGESENLLITIFPTVSPLDVSPRSGQWVICTGPDNGMQTVPAAQIAALGQPGQSALIAVTRTRIQSADVEGNTVTLTASTSFGTLITLAE